MTRKHAEKIANAIVARARKNGNAWTSTAVALAEVAEDLRKPAEALRAEIFENASTIWGCLPMGWQISLPQRGAVGTIEVRRAA